MVYVNVTQLDDMRNVLRKTLMISMTYMHWSSSNHGKTFDKDLTMNDIHILLQCILKHIHILVNLE